MCLRWWSGLAALSLALFATGPAVAQPAAPPVPSGSGTNGAPPGVVLPRLKTRPDVSYPERALADGQRAVVSVELTLEIDADGKVQKATVVTPRGHGFDEAAVAAAEKSTFEPARRDGVAFAAKIRFEVVFRPPEEKKVEIAGPSDASKAEKNEGAGGAPGDSGAANKAGAPDKAPPSDKGSASPVVDVSVYGERAPRDVTKRTLTQEELAVIPGTNGDALRALQALPGVARAVPTLGLLIVRGSAPADTDYMVDGTPVPIVYHFGGLSSVLPTEVLGKIDFYPGNYSAAYGRGMGGLVDVGVKAPRSDGLHAMAQVDLLDIRLLAEGPIFKTGWKFLVAGRRSWFDVWLTPLLLSENSRIVAGMRYYDYQAILQNDLTPTSSLRLLFFGSRDETEILNPPGNTGAAVVPGGLDYRLGFWRLQARYENRISDRTEIRATLAGGQDTYSFKQGDYAEASTSTPISTRVELTQKVMRGVTANVGIDVVLGPYNSHLTQPVIGLGAEPGATEDTERSGFRFFTASYTEWELRPWRGMRVVPGLRVDYSSSTKTWDASPRIFARQDLTRGFPRTSLKGGVGLFYQPPSALETDPVLGTPGLVSNRSVQTDFGVEQELTRQLELSVDLFYKDLGDLVTSGVGNVGEGAAFGAEWLLRYKPDERFFGWIAYTLSRSERRSWPEAPTVLTPFDQTHILTVLGSYQLPHGFRAGLRFRLVSGNPYTPIREGVYNATEGNYTAISGYPPNGARLPLFHELDLRVDKRFQFKSWAFTVYLDILNVYNQSNVEGLLYNYNYTRSAEVASLPIIPSLGLRGEL